MVAEIPSIRVFYKHYATRVLKTVNRLTGVVTLDTDAPTSRSEMERWTAIAKASAAKVFSGGNTPVSRGELAAWIDALR